MQDIHYKHNNILLQRIDQTYKTGPKSINSIATSLNIMKYVEGYHLLEVNEIIISNHRSYLVDVNLE